MANWSRINVKMILRFVGIMLMILGVFIALCVPFAVWYDEGDAFSIALSALIVSSSGLFLRVLAWRVADKVIRNRDAYLIVALGWLALAVSGSLPYLLSGTISDFPGAFFESVSGLTTTGASVLRDVESVTHGILFWRSISQWLGGMGFVMLVITIIPILGTGGLKVITADILDLTSEKPGKTLISSIRWLWVAYTTVTLLIAVSYKLGGMCAFDAVCYAFTTISTGGFSTHNNNVAFFSRELQYMIMFFMLLAGVNFPLVIKALKGKPLNLLRSEELRYYIFLIFGASVLIAGVLFFNNKVDIETALRQSFFQVISIITTTGFVITDYTLWPSAVLVIILLLMLTGSCSGSSGGGLKVMRQLILLKNTSNTIKSVVHPNAVYVVRIDGKNVNEDLVYNVLAYYFMYLIVFAFGSLCISFTGIDFHTSISITAASVGNIGPGFSETGPFPVYDAFPAITKFMVSAFMLIGRLELFAVLILFSKAFWSVK